MSTAHAQRYQGSRNQNVQIVPARGKKPLRTEAIPPLSLCQKSEGERIELLELLPKKEWFIRTTFRGKVNWHVRLSVTGFRPRIFGPFPSRRAALLFLDGAHDKLADFWSEIEDVVKRYSCRGEFQFIPGGSLIEHPLAAPRQEGR